MKDVQHFVNWDSLSSWILVLIEVKLTTFTVSRNWGEMRCSLKIITLLWELIFFDNLNKLWFTWFDLVHWYLFLKFQEKWIIFTKFWLKTVKLHYGLIKSNELLIQTKDPVLEFLQNIYMCFLLTKLYYFTFLQQIYILPKNYVYALLTNFNF